MIFNIFIPESLNGYYLFSKTIAGISCTDQYISASKIRLKRKNIFLTYMTTISFPEKKEPFYKTVRSVIDSLGLYDSLILSVASNNTAFATMKFPFIDREKIKLILAYELEPHLPFPVSEAYYDFIFTDRNIKENESTIMVAAMLKKDLDGYFHAFNQIGVSLDAVTLDIFNLYGLYHVISLLGEQKKSVFLIEIDENNTRIAYIANGILQTVRIIHQTFSLEQSEKLFQKINFTIQSCTKGLEQPDSLYILEQENTQGKLISSMQDFLGIYCAPLNSDSLFKEIVQNDTKKSLSGNNTIAFATSFPTVTNQSFNLSPIPLSSQEQSLMNKQLITSAILSLLLFGILFAHSYVQISRLSNVLDTTKRTITQTLKKNFPKIHHTNVQDILIAARKHLKQEESIWSVFSTQTQKSFLRYLYVLSTVIDRETLNLHLKKMILGKQTIILEGSVHNFEAVERLEQQLKETGLFVHVPTFEKTEFIVSLPIKDKGVV